ncbi:MAG TPA: leucyl aminopeptidase, partial [Candidatus Dormibacteraeota bacterium]|nr:leucyl aminopeptidase [Candidatus Dormibacteraeota bacterium]
DGALGGTLGEMRARKELTGKFAQRPVVRSLGRIRAPRVQLLGLGKPADLDGFRLHNAFHLAGQDLRASGVRRVAVAMDAGAIAAAVGDGAGGRLRVEDVARAAATGLLLGNWRSRTDNADEDEPAQPGIESVELLGLAGSAEVQGSLADAAVLAEATNQARTWMSAPSNQLTPTMLAGQATALLEGAGVEVEVLDLAELESRGMGALLAIARGSDEPPVMICARWDGGPPDGPRLGLIGKGITFDTGGISIKPSGGMEAMKMDMGGGAAVLGALLAIARLGVRANVVAVVPATENMPGGRATKPGDVVRSRSGKTIEIINTDAEGRVVLADGLAQAREMGATHLVDVATLTGAVVVALGHAVAAMMTTDAALLGMITAASAVGGDRFAELPIPPEYDVVLHSDVADMRNIGSGREAGSIAGGVFIREFAGDLPWVHLDIAGTAWNDQGDLRAVPSGPSGTPLRTLVALARAFSAL